MKRCVGKKYNELDPKLKSGDFVFAVGGYLIILTFLFGIAAALRFYPEYTFPLFLIAGFCFFVISLNIERVILPREKKIFVLLCRIYNKYNEFLAENAESTEEYKKEINRVLAITRTLSSRFENSEHSGLLQYNTKILREFSEVFERKLSKPLKKVKNETQKEKINFYLGRFADAFYEGDIEKINEITMDLRNEKKLLTIPPIKHETNTDKIMRNVRWLFDLNWFFNIKGKTTLSNILVSGLASIVLVKIVVKFFFANEQSYQLGATILLFMFIYQMPKKIE